MRLIGQRHTSALTRLCIIFAINCTRKPDRIDRTGRVVHQSKSMVFLIGQIEELSTYINSLPVVVQSSEFKMEFQQRKQGRNEVHARTDRGVKGDDEE